jgi:hypothetical protein
MTNQEAINSIYSGSLVNCTSEEYHSGIRAAIQDQAGKWIDKGEHLRAVIALNEVKRLDEKYPSNEEVIS